ncbi:MAG: hypothetical protein WCA12_08295 [Burkholderiales bacterium]
MQIEVIRTRAGLAAGVPAEVTLPFLFAQGSPRGIDGGEPGFVRRLARLGKLL